MKITNQKQSHKEDNHKSKVIKKLLNASFIVILLVISFYVYRDSFHDIMTGIRQVTLQQLCISSLFSIFYYILEGIIIFCMACMMIPGYPLKDGILTAFVCEFYRLITLGSGAGIAEVHCLYQSGMEPARGTILSILQFIMKKTGVMVLGVVGFICLMCGEGTRSVCKEYRDFLAAGCIITMGIVLVLLFISLSVKFKDGVMWILEKASEKFPSQIDYINNLEKQIIQLNQTGREIFRQKKRLVGIIFLNLIKLTSFYCIPAYLLYGKSPLNTVECIMLMAVVYMLAGIIPTPSGVGSLEFVFLLFFGAFADSGIAVAAILVFRFVTWILPFLIGGILLLFRKICASKTS